MNYPPLVVTPPATVRLFQKKVLIALPWYKSVSPITAFCVVQLADKRRTSTALNFDDAFVVHSRNSIADYFLKSDNEWLLSIDDDMVVPFGHAEWFRTFTGWSEFPEKFAALNSLDRLMSHGKTLVGATYFGRHWHGVPVFGEGNNPTVAAEIRKGPVDECRPTRWVGTGCLLVHRTVFEDIEKKFPNLARGADKKRGQWFTSSEHVAMDAIRRTREMLATGPMTGEKSVKALEMLIGAESDARAKASLGQGEDVTFCKRAFEAGHQPYVDFGLVCGHIGSACYGPFNTRPK